MRTQTIQQMTVTYPDYLVFSEDNNFIQLTATSGTAAMVVTLGSYQQVYYGETDTVVMDVSRLFKRYGTYNAAISMTIYISRTNPTASQTLTVSFYVVKGRTLADRYHCSGRKIILPPGSTSVELLADGEATTITINPVSTTTAAIMTVPITDSTTIEVQNTTASPRGWFIDGESTTSVYYEVEIASCTPKNGAFLRWLDTDGCKRFAPCKIMTRGSKIEQINYADGLQTLRTPASRLVSSVQRSIEVGIAQVDPALHLEEIVYSPEILLVCDNGETVTLVPEFTDYTGSVEKIEDITLKFLVQR